MTSRAKNSSERYGSVAMAFHWTIAIMILANIALGFYFNEIFTDRHAPGHSDLIQIHKSIGLTVLILSVGRLVWRLMNPQPPFPSGMSLWWRIVARSTHYLLYVLMIGVPLLGWALTSASRSRIPTYYLGFITWPNIGVIADLPRDQKGDVGHFFSLTHKTAAYMLLALVVGHLAAALYHHYSRKDNVLRRMLPAS
jgi:cytochrome b561